MFGIVECLPEYPDIYKHLLLTELLRDPEVVVEVLEAVEGNLKIMKI